MKTQEFIKPNIMNIPISSVSGNFWIKHKYRAAAIGTGAILAAVSIAAVATGVGYTATPSIPDVSQAQAFERGTDDAGGKAAGTPASAPVVSVPAVPEQVPAPPAAAEPAVVPAPAPEPAPPPAEPGPDTNLYTVASGDTVGAIAARFGVDVNAMLAANGLFPYSVIVPGQVLKLTGPPVALAPAPQAAPAPAVAAAQAPVASVRTIYVAGSGGQAAVDSCIGPIHFTPTDAYAVFITEHDFCGGWARFSGIGVGETVSIPGYGTYTVTGRGQVPQGGTTNNVAAVFGGFPRVVLQTCIPGTTQMLVIGLN